MSTDITRRKTPEESELEQKQANLKIFEEELTQHELGLATIKADLRIFEGRYLRIVGIRYAELDEIKAQIAKAQARLNPTNKGAQKQASQARAQAQESERTTESAREQRKQKKFIPSDELKRLYREAAKSMHPDLTTDQKARTSRQRMMAEANRAYEEGDEDRLHEMLEQWESSPEAVEGEETGAELIRTIRKIAQVEVRLQAINIEIAELKKSDLCQLKQKVEKAENKGRDLLAEMATEIETQIVEAKQHLHDLNIQRDADVYFNRGIAYGKKGEYDGAISDYTKTIEINPDHLGARLYRSDSYYQKGECDKAASDYAKAINIDPVSAIAYYKKKKRHDKVISSLIGAREIDPELAEILKVEINKVLAALTPREEKVLRIYFGIGEKTDHTLEEIAQDFDVTPERIRQIKAKALKKLRRWHSRKE